MPDQTSIEPDGKLAPGHPLWPNRFRRRITRCERRADVLRAFLQLGCALIALRFLG